MRKWRIVYAVTGAVGLLGWVVLHPHFWQWIALGIGLVCATVCLLAYHPSSREEIGDRLAIRLKENELKSLGVTEFFRRDEYRRLEHGK